MISKEKLGLNDWTPEKLRETRLRMNLSQKAVGEILGVSGMTISNIEREKYTNPMHIMLYGIVLERYYAYKRGYVPAFRKIGENKFMEVRI